MKNTDVYKNKQINIQNFLRMHATIMNILNENNQVSAMFVGGCVRDILKGEKNPKDIDVSTTILPEFVVEKLIKYKNQQNKIDKTTNITILDKDKKYGTIIAILNGRRYEITTTRNDIMCYGREAEVKFCNSFQQDSERRDFTINALYLDPEGKIYDFHNGIEDLQNNTIRFIGNADKRIKEDYLRIIRFFRFSTKYCCSIIETATEIAIDANKNGILKLSRERIRNEIWKMMTYANWSFGLYQMNIFHLIENIFLLENFQINSKIAKTTEQKKNDKTFLPQKSEIIDSKLKFIEITRLFYFFNFNIAIMEKLCETLKFTREEKRFIEFLKKYWIIFNSEYLTLELKLILTGKNAEFYKEILWLLDEKRQNEILNFLQNFKPLPITPKDLIELGFAGKIIGEHIKKLNVIWIKNNFSISKDELLKTI